MAECDQRVPEFRNRLLLRQGSTIRAGFTLVEIMVVVMIIGVMVALAIPAFARARRNALATRTARDYRTFETAFVQYAMERGSWPADVIRGTIPAAMVPYMRGDAFTKVTPVGGNWDWDLNQFGVKAGLSIVDTQADEATMQRIDAILDDGNLATGRFRQTGATRFTLVLED